MSDKKIDNLYAALKLIEILLEKGLINQATYSNIVKNAKSHNFLNKRVNQTSVCLLLHNK